MLQLWPSWAKFILSLDTFSEVRWVFSSFFDRVPWSYPTVLHTTIKTQKMKTETLVHTNFDKPPLQDANWSRACWIQNRLWLTFHKNSLSNHTLPTRVEPRSQENERKLFRGRLSSFYLGSDSLPPPQTCLEAAWRSSQLPTVNFCALQTGRVNIP